MKIVMELKKVIMSDRGTSVRPGIANLMAQIHTAGHKVAVWTNMPKSEARGILEKARVGQFVSQVIGAEDIRAFKTGNDKDIRKIKGDVLIDVDPLQMRFAVNKTYKVIIIPPFVEGQKPSEQDLLKVMDNLPKSGGFFSRLFGGR